MRTVSIEKIDHADEAVKKKLIDLLAPRETHNLFILGNLKTGFADSHVYVASSGGKWVGVAAYYAIPKSLIPSCENERVARALVRHIAPLHPRIEYVNGMEAFARPACEELQALGYTMNDDPRMVFMELEGEPPRQEHEGLARPMRESDAESWTRLMRHVRGAVPEDAPIPEDDLARARRTFGLRQVLEADGRMVSTAGTNGIGLAAFQIIGVVTHPDARRRGYASAVCASLVRRMAREGAARCVLFTHVNNQTAQHCYEKLGFRATGSYYVARFTPPAQPS